MRPLTFYGTKTILMGGYFSNVMLFNFKTGNVNMLQ